MDFLETPKLCNACNEVKPLKEFSKYRKVEPSRRPCCKLCQAKKNREWRNKNKNKVRGYNLKQKRSISMAEYNTLFDQQKGVCLICKCSPEQAPMGVLVVDHCHSTGTIRGLLCASCNTGLGYFKDNIEFLSKAITYLEKSV